MPGMPDMADATLPPVHVACLCAAWCRLCEGYAQVFGEVTTALRLQHPYLQAHWIDIEDEYDLLGDLDIETFPTIVVAEPGAVRFAGTLTPQPETLRRVLGAALAQRGTPAATPTREVAAFAARLVHRVPPAGAPGAD
jgi:hypothetical protein